MRVILEAMKQDTQPSDKNNSIWSCPTCGQSEYPPTDAVELNLDDALRRLSALRGENERLYCRLAAIEIANKPSNQTS
jgi:hypothetical protein